MNKDAHTPPRRIGLVGFDDVMAMDVAGPSEVFHAANEAAGAMLYEIVVIAQSAGPFTAESGLVFQAAVSMAQAPPVDTLIVPGGRSLRTMDQAALVAFVAERAPTTRRMVSVCTGLYVLAATGLMDGRRATTHWRHAADFKARFPKVQLEPDVIFTHDGPFHTSGGVTADIDLALALVEADHGPGLALEAARDLVVFFKRPGGQRQYSEQLHAQSQGRDRLADLAAWMMGNLQGDLSIQALAARAGLSERHFTRRFTSQFNTSPRQYVADLRLEAAARLLATTGRTIDAVAAAVGYKSDDVFRRAFTQRSDDRP